MMQNKETIHVINRSNFTKNILDQILESNDSLLLISDGIYYLAQISKNKKIYVIEDDLKIRIPNLSTNHMNVNLIDFNDFVNLSLTHNVINW